MPKSSTKPQPLTLTQQALLQIYELLLEAENATLTAIDQAQHEDTNNPDTTTIEGRIERISAILSDYHTNHTG